MIGCGVNRVITVLFFAKLSEQLDCRSMSFVLPLTVNTVKQVREHLISLNREWTWVLNDETLLAAVNQEMVSGKHIVTPGDEVAFFPPVTGG